MPGTTRFAGPRTFRTVLVALAVSMGMSAITCTPAHAAAPPDRFTFTFEFSLSHRDDPSAVAFTVATKGTSVGPDRQECTATVGFGELQVSLRAVEIGPRVWIGEGGNLDRATKAEFGWSDACPGSDAFWRGFPTTFPRGLEGTPETIGRTRAIRVELTEMSHAMSPLGVVPDGTTVDQIVLWQARGRSAVVGLESTMTATTAESCRALAGPGALEVPVPCRVTVALHLDRIDDGRLRVGEPD